MIQLKILQEYLQDERNHNRLHIKWLNEMLAIKQK